MSTYSPSRLSCVAIALLIMTFSVAVLAKKESELQKIPEGYHSVTVYIDANWGGKTKKAARDISESHNRHAAKGYKFADLEIYTEDGDLKGFFVTYEKQ